MAKHSKGKHAAGAAKGDAAEQKPEAAAPEAEEAKAGDSAPANEEEKPSGEDADAADEEAAPDDERASGDDEKKPSDEPDEADGASDAAEAEQPAAERPVEIPSTRRRLKRALIATGSAVGFLAAVYFIGVGVFSFHFMPNTTIAGVDFSWQTPDQMAGELDQTLADHTFSVVGKGMNFKVTSKEAGLTSDSVGVSQEVLASENAWAWPVEVFQDHDCTAVFTDTLRADGLDEVVAVQTEAINATAKQPTNATVAFSEEAGAFVGVPEIKGTAIDPQALKETILAGLLNLSDKVVLTDEVLVQPTILIDDPRVQAATDQANAYSKADFDVLMADTAVTHVGPSLIAQWVSISPELEVAFDEGALTAWAEGVAKSCNTVGTTRTYTRPDGKQVTVSGGSYGWKIDNNALASQVVEAVKEGSTQALAAPVIQSGSGFTSLGGQDWGSRYIDVDLSEQYARYYDNGQVIWESVIVSGNPNQGNSTPTGVYTGNQKISPTVLRGRIQEDGKPEYESPVQYWMPFIGNSVGFHDASWQAAYGGSRYLTNGSKGCINLPYNAAQALYGMFNAGDVVVVHR